MFSSRMLVAAATAALSFGLTMVQPTDASAATTAVTVTGVNLRAGPSTGYPVVTSMPSNASLSLYGCTANTSWCDVSWGGQRGWVAANYVQVVYRGSTAVVTPAIAPVIGITVVAFSQAYWNTYYVGRPWHHHWDRYHHGHRAVAVGGCNDNGCAGAVAGPRRAAVGGCNDNGCAGAVAGPRRAAVGGCNDNGCAGGSVRPGRAAVGKCSDGTCSGTVAKRGPAGNVRVRHGSVSRP